MKQGQKNNTKQEVLSSKQKVSAKTEKTISFWAFMKEKRQYIEFFALAAFYIIAYFIYTTAYPYPGCNAGDSFGYVTAAAANSFFVYRPFGYSYFLQLIHYFSASIHAPTVGAYIMQFIAAAYILFSCKYLFKIKNTILYYIFIACIIITPFYFYLSNYLLSDSLFASLTTIWVVSMIWIIKKPKVIIYIVHALALFWLLHTRYVALFYIAFSVAFIFWASWKKWVHLALALFFVLLGSYTFYAQTKKSVKEVVGLNQFAAGFSGWQLTNNVLYIMPYIDVSVEDMPTPRLKVFHQMVRNQMDEIKHEVDSGGVVPGTYFMWSKTAPQKQYLQYTLEQGRAGYYLKAWVLAGNDFSEYGSFIIKKYPLEFLRYYCLKNLPHAILIRMGELGFYYDTQRIDTETLNKWFDDVPPTGEYKAAYPFANHLNDLYRYGYLAFFVVIVLLSLSVLVLDYKLLNFKRENMPFWLAFTFIFAYTAANVYGSGALEIRYFMPIVMTRALVFYFLIDKLLTGISTRRKGSANLGIAA